MPALPGEPFRGAARADVFVTLTPANRDSAFVTTASGSPQPTGNQTIWDGLPGTAITLRFKWTRATGSTSGLAQAPNFATIDARLPGAAASFGANTWTLGAGGDDAFPAAGVEVSRTFHFDTDPLNFAAGTIASGMLEIYLNWGSTGGLGPWNADSRGAGATNALDSRDNARGKLRSPRIVTNDPAPSNVAIGGAQPSLFASPDPIHTRIVTSAVTYRAVALEMELLRTGTSTVEREQTLAAQTAVNHDYSWTGTTGSNRRVGNGMALASEAKDLRLKMAALDFGGDNEYVFGDAVLDSSASLRHGLLVGTTKPSRIASPFSGFGNALSFDGVDLDDNSAGVNCGVRTGFGVSTSDGSMRIKAKIRRGRTGVIEILASKWSYNNEAEQNWVLFINSSNLLQFGMWNSAATFISATGTTSLAVGTNYDVEGEWTGAVLRVKVNGIQEGTTPSLTALQPPDAITPMTIGRGTNGSQEQPASPYPFQGVIDEVEMIRGGVMQALYRLDEAAFTFDSELQLTIANQLTVDPRVTIFTLFQPQGAGQSFATPPSSGDVDTGQRIFPDVGFLSARFTNARGEGLNGLNVTQKTWDTDNITGTETTPTHSHTETTATRRTDTSPTEAGWLPKQDTGSPVERNKLGLVWSAVAAGTWRVKSVINTPADLTGLELRAESSGSDTWDRNVFLIVVSPNLVTIIVGKLGLESLEGTHWSPGKPLFFGAALLDMNTQMFEELIPGNDDVARAILLRLDAATGLVEYLDPDDYVWKPKAIDGAMEEFELVPASSLIAGGDDDVFVLEIDDALQGATWTSNNKDILIAIRLQKDGVSYPSSLQLESVGNVHPHDTAISISLAGGNILADGRHVIQGDAVTIGAAIENGTSKLAFVAGTMKAAIRRFRVDLGTIEHWTGSAWATGDTFVYHTMSPSPGDSKLALYTLPGSANDQKTDLLVRVKGDLAVTGTSTAVNTYNDLQVIVVDSKFKHDDYASGDGSASPEGFP